MLARTGTSDRLPLYSCLYAMAELERNLKGTNKTLVIFISKFENLTICINLVLTALIYTS